MPSSSSLPSSPSPFPAHTCTSDRDIGLPCPACVAVGANGVNREVIVVTPISAPAPSPVADYTGYIHTHLDNARIELALVKDRAELLKYPADFRSNLMTGIRLINLVLDRHAEIKAEYTSTNRKTK